MSNRDLSCLRIAVNVPVDGTFSYAVPKGLVSKANVGCRVLVSFRNRKVTGYILERTAKGYDKELKEIFDVIDPEPLFPKSLVPFFEWMASYYIHPIGQVIQSGLPGGLNIKSYKTALLTQEGRRALERLHSNSEQRRILSWIRDHPGKGLPRPLQKVSGLQKKGWLVVEDRLKKGHGGPLIRKFVRAKEGIDLRTVLSERGGILKAGNELQFLETVFNSHGILLSKLTGMFTNGSYLVEKWIGKGVLESYRGAVYRNPAGEIISPSPLPPKLYKQQELVLDHIKACIDKGSFSTCLLYGVTGSGKTEVYYRAAEHVMALGRQAIMMAPEISLAVYLEGIFRSRLGDRVAIYHSGLSQGERYDQWMRIVRGEVDLVIGARSALFSPLPRLGLIIVDEEHDSAYKQDRGPRYNARDAAVVRAKMEKALVILGSGTPSVQSYQNGISGRYHLLSMPERIEKRPLPDVEIVDMKITEDMRSKREMISPRLKEALEQNLMDGNQCMLFLNRRGFYRVYLCRSCGQSLRCPNCDVALIYHLEENRLSCHYCGYYSETRTKCSSCGNEGLRAYGFGTEKLEYELRELFPEARIARMDADSTRRKGQAIQILKRFAEQKLDILVGTQMITKGYDFPNVTLVGVIAADLSLGFPDFRAGERTFQVLSQVSGRSGRGDQKGKVIIQTFNPDHYAISTATAHDYQSFFREERQLREQLGYPPFSHLACLTLKGNSKKGTEEAAQQLNQAIRGTLAKWPRRGKEIHVLGPAEAPISRLKGKYRWQILVKSKNVSLMRHLLTRAEQLKGKIFQSSGVSLILDMDPYHMI
ncbi:MAG: primosomal protein N' [Desulfatiglandaceae bacterium]